MRAFEQDLIFSKVVSGLRTAGGSRIKLFHSKKLLELQMVLRGGEKQLLVKTFHLKL